MKFKWIHSILFSTLLTSFFFGCTAQEIESVPKQIKPRFDWQRVGKGMNYCETEALSPSILGDSKISILKIQPDSVEFHLLSATQLDKKPRTVCEWADSFDLDIVLNAGMYDLSHKLLSRGYLKNYEHLNNPIFNPSYNSMIAFNPADSLQSRFQIMDLTCATWEKEKKKYHSFAQGMRMIDCNGEALSWSKKKQSCSMLVAAMDEMGNLYFVFTRSPYTHNEMIQFLLSLPFEIRQTIYLEGGPETSLYIRTGQATIEKIGSYVSNTYANDNNADFWALPNVIGIRVKK